MTTPELIAFRLREAKEKKGITFTELSLRSGLHKRTLEEVLENGRNPRATTLAAICEALEVSPAWVLGIKNGGNA